MLSARPDMASFSSCDDIPDHAKLKAPVSTFAPITREEGFTERSFPSVSSLELSLAKVFGVKMSRLVGQRPVPPSKHDQLVMMFTDRAHQCVFQAAVATNNTALLAFGISKKAEEADLPEELKSFICKAADAILNVCATLAACSSRIAAWSTLVQRATWLRLSPSMPEDLQKDMLEGPITPDALFSPNFQTILEKSQKTDEVSETVRHL
ncbi:hypothetical protein GOODEAATRI_027542, partial [Goodea atripinnis]